MCYQRGAQTKAKSSQTGRCKSCYAIKPPIREGATKPVRDSEDVTTSNRDGHIPVPIHHRLIPPPRRPPVFVLRPIERARRDPGRCGGSDVARK
jgi:hypothetical protein